MISTTILSLLLIQRRRLNSGTVACSQLLGCLPDENWDNSWRIPNWLAGVFRYIQ